MGTIMEEKLNVHVRWMIRRDLSNMLRIERQCFESPWTGDDFIRCLRLNHCIGMVAEHGYQMAGFMLYELHRNRLNLVNFAVAKRYQRRGVGTAMMRKLDMKIHPSGRNSITTCVSEFNLGAQLFFKSQGFEAVSVLHEYFRGSHADAYLMQKKCEGDQ